ncbi:MAG: hypothetical protein LBU11_00165, partial [Zoogloeaceae bacterium]|nr:hypothetical protein [Zoogloeaceae bacterium]
MVVFSGTGRKADPVSRPGQRATRRPARAAASGGVIHKSIDLCRPGHVLARRAPGDRFLFGSPLPDGYASEGEAALPTQKSRGIRRDVREKLLGNAMLNPISALANASIADIVDFAPTHALSLAAIRETLNVAAYNPAFDITPANLITAIITENGPCLANRAALALHSPEKWS